jgi:ATP-binding cassette subfamily G (WHITE) protein 2 (SNQ2)
MPDNSVETCLKMCGLTAFADAAVGSLGVEQRKRTTIAVELAAKVGSDVVCTVEEFL